MSCFMDQRRLPTASRAGHGLLFLGGLLCGVCLGLAGCGGAQEGRRPTAEVTGQVMYHSAPVARGEVKFIPVPSDQPGVRVAYGSLDSQGRYCLSTYGDRDGAILGTYAVTVESREEPSPDVGKMESPDGSALARRSKSLIPERYADPQTSGLNAQVRQGSNTFDFTLED